MLIETQPQQQGSKLDMAASYPLSKGGSLGSLVRECRITEAGLEEREGNGKPKVKKLTGFIDAI